MLWTWQGFDFDPLLDRLDRSKSEFLTCPGSCPDIRRAYADLDKLLSLPPDRKHQFVWCFTTDSCLQNPWNGRRLWRIDVPQDSILAYVNDCMWNHLIGSKSVPMSLRNQWKNELYSKRAAGEQFDQEISWREREYHDSFPSREACLAALLSPKGPGEDVSALVSLPFDESWIGS